MSGIERVQQNMIHKFGIGHGNRYPHSSISPHGEIGYYPIGRVPLTAYSALKEKPNDSRQDA